MNNLTIEELNNIKKENIENIEIFKQKNIQEIKNKLNINTSILLDLVCIIKYIEKIEINKEFESIDILNIRDINLEKDSKDKTPEKLRQTYLKKLEKEKVSFGHDYGDKKAKYYVENIEENKDDLFDYVFKKLMDLKKEINSEIAKKELKIKLENVNKNQIYFGAPGTGKSYAIKEIEKLSNESYGEENVLRTTFHESYDYSDFMGQYKPTMKDGDIEYSYCTGIFLDSLIRALNTDDPVFLVIEELNRGNCAEIFGDVFQLLDRNENGESEYGVTISAEIFNYIKNNIEGAIERKECLIKDFEESKKSLKDLSENPIISIKDKIKLIKNILNNKKIKIPSNLYILATMNTSDQSLYPIDSAFKRRWEMEFIEIEYNHNRINSVMIDYGYDMTSYSKVIEALNNIILKATESEDKQMGQFFISLSKISDDIVEYKDIKNKILQYLFFDVFKHNREDVFSSPQFSILIKNNNFEDCFKEQYKLQFKGFK